MPDVLEKQTTMSFIYIPDIPTSYLDTTYNFPNKSEQTLRDSKTPKMLARKLANSAIFHIKYEKSAVLSRLGDK